MTNEEQDQLEQLLEKLKNDRILAPARLNAAILTNLPRQNGLDLLGWYRGSFWRPVYAAALPLLFGFGLGFFDLEEGNIYDVDDLLFATEYHDTTLSDAIYSLDQAGQNDE
ncbi:MAG: hypothetical protein GKR90_19985 [Pseudomonadales bacterium]|nr:hypothetical protein [Pseudomonadales bacterium]